MALISFSGAPQVGTTVTWATASGVVTGNGPTDATGIATADWTLGNTAGAVTATATLAGATGTPQTFTATANPDVPETIAISAGNNQTGFVGDALTPLQVKVTDQFNNAVAGVNVGWAVTSGVGNVAPGNSATNATGIASSTLTLGGVAGDVTVDATATVPNGSPQTFTATADPLPIAITIQVGTPGSNFTPKVGTVAAGGTVTWNWAAPGHTVTDDPAGGTFTDHPAIGAAGTVLGPVTFPTAGTFAYYCSQHGGPGGVGMSGSIVVK